MSDEKTMIHDDLDQNTTTLPEAQGTGGADARIPTKEGLEANDDTTMPKTSTKNVLTDQTNLLPTKQVITVFIALSIALMCSFLDQTIVATALPKIASNLRSGKESAWVATAYLLTSLAFTPLYGRWSDVFGRKQVLIAALGIFWIFSLACAVAQSMLQLIIFRALQGIGGGALITMCLIIISDIVSLEDRGKYMGITEAVIAISNGVGPILGGVFSEYTSWRWAFWINLPLGGIAIAVSLWFLPLKPVQGNAMEKLKRIDYLGSLLTVIASVLLLLGLNWGGITYSWTSAQVLVTLILGVVIFAGFLAWEGKGAQLPIVPVHIFRHKTVVGVYIATCMNGMTYFTVLYYVPQFLQLVRGSSAVTSSLLALPFLCPVAFFVFLSGQIAGRTGHYRYVIIAGYTLWCVAQGLQSTIAPQSSNARIAVYLLLGGIGAGCTFQTSLLAAQAVVPRSDMAVVTGVRNFVRLLGSTFALAISGALVNNSLRSAIAPLHLSDLIKDSLLDDPTIINSPTFRATLTEHQHDAILSGYQRGFKSVFYLTITCVCVAWLASVLLIGQHNLKRADDAQLKEEGKRRLEEMKNKRKMGDAENSAGMNTAATSAAPSRRQSGDEKVGS